MTQFMRPWLHLAAVGVLCALALAVFSAWRADRRERSQLHAELSAAQKTLAQLTAEQDNRNARLNRTLRELAQQKKSVTTPAQALREFPGVLPLPTAIRDATLPLTAQLQPASPIAAKSSATPPKAILLPTEDVKPLFDFAVDCKACQARLAAAQADLVDEKAKTAAVSKERDDALRAARGGSVWKRIGRAAKWFAIGAAAGALAGKAAH